MTGGRLAVVGLGPGDPDLCTPAAARRLAAATDLVGYGPYLDMVPPGGPAQIRHRFDNREEAKRATFALDLAAAGRDVAVVSSGDPGVFAMAAAMVEELHRRADDPATAAVEFTVLAGVTAATAAAACRGAALGHDFCVLSLSDILKPFEVVERRLDAAAGADFVLALYNPASKHRPTATRPGPGDHRPPPHRRHPGRRRPRRRPPGRADPGRDTGNPRPRRGRHANGAHRRIDHDPPVHDR